MRYTEVQAEFFLRLLLISINCAIEAVQFCIYSLFTGIHMALS